MHILTLSTLTALLLALTAATPNSPTTPDDTTFPYNYIHTEPDPRFENFTLPHPNARIYTEHSSPAVQKRVTSGNKRTVYGIYECSDLYFHGSCRWSQLQPGEFKCFNAQWGPLNSIGPDKGVTCDIYEKKDCEEKGARKKGLVFPGVGNCADDVFTSSAGELVNCPRSWKCRVTG